MSKVVTAQNKITVFPGMVRPLEKDLICLSGSEVCNFDIDLFVFRHCFRITGPKFLKFERVLNSAVKI
jgi:hypothetical protein